MARRRPRPGARFADRQDAEDALLTFTSGPLPGPLHVVGFPVVSLRLATSGSDGAVYVYLEDVSPDGEVTNVTEGRLRFVHRATTGPAEPSWLGVPRSFARADGLPVTPGRDLDLTVELLPVAAMVRAGHKSGSHWAATTPPASAVRAARQDVRPPTGPALHARPPGPGSVSMTRPVTRT